MTFHDLANQSLHYLTLAGALPYRPGLLPTALSHPVGVVYDDQLFTAPAQFADYLNTTYAAPGGLTPDEQVPDTLGLPHHAPSDDEQRWLDFWLARAAWSPWWPYTGHDRVDRGTSYRLPNIPAAVLAIMHADTQDHDDTDRPLVYMIPGHFCAIRIAVAPDTWWLGNLDHYDDAQPLQTLAYDPPGENLYALLHALQPHGACGIPRLRPFDYGQPARFGG